MLREGSLARAPALRCLKGCRNWLTGWSPIQVSVPAGGPVASLTDPAEDVGMEAPIVSRIWKGVKGPQLDEFRQKWRLARSTMAADVGKACCSVLSRPHTALLTCWARCATGERLALARAPQLLAGTANLLATPAGACRAGQGAGVDMDWVSKLAALARIGCEHLATSNSSMCNPRPVQIAPGISHPSLGGRTRIIEEAAVGVVNAHTPAGAVVAGLAQGEGRVWGVEGTRCARKGRWFHAFLHRWG